MSVNRENVTWQSKDGKWNIGFWDFYNTGSYDDPDFDYEWDVEYSSSEFWFLSRGHATPDQAYAAYTRNNANPGGTVEVPFTEKTAEEISKYEEIAAKFGKAGVR